MIKLVALLGNIGREYENTRHNVAWLFAEALPFSYKLSWQKKFKGQYAVIDGTEIATWAEAFLQSTETKITPPQATRCEKIYFLKPETYMNASGDSVSALAAFFKIEPHEILVVHDELELIPGTISLKWSGGLGGHNGLRSMKSSFGTADFWRLRFGIGRPNHPDVAGYVLSRFTEDERITLDISFKKATELFALLLTESKPEKLLKEWAKVKI